MLTTSRSLLARLRTETDTQAWQSWLAVYEPLLRCWLWQLQPSLQPSDGDDVLQEILLVVHNKLPTFDHNGSTGAFRKWLKLILTNKVRKFREGRKKASENLPDWLAQLEDPLSEISRRWDAEYDRQVALRALALVRPDFTPGTWEAFRLLVLEDRPTAEVARLCQMTRNAVYIARSRVLARLREVIKGLIEE